MHTYAQILMVLHTLGQLLLPRTEDFMHTHNCIPLRLPQSSL